MTIATLHGIPPQICEIENGNVYFKKISGISCAYDLRLSKPFKHLKKKTGFVDMSDNGNIIQDPNTKINYIVDTEYKSFQIELDTYTYNASDYLNNRFLHWKKINDIEEPYETYEFMLED